MIYRYLAAAKIFLDFDALLSRRSLPTPLIAAPPRRHFASPLLILVARRYIYDNTILMVSPSPPPAASQHFSPLLLLAHAMICRQYFLLIIAVIASFSTPFRATCHERFQYYLYIDAAFFRRLISQEMPRSPTASFRLFTVYTVSALLLFFCPIHSTPYPQSPGSMPLPLWQRCYSDSRSLLHDASLLFLGHSA